MPSSTSTGRYSAAADTLSLWHTFPQDLDPDTSYSQVSWGDKKNHSDQTHLATLVLSAISASRPIDSLKKQGGSRLTLAEIGGKVRRAISQSCASCASKTEGTADSTCSHWASVPYDKRIRALKGSTTQRPTLYAFEHKSGLDELLYNGDPRLGNSTLGRFLPGSPKSAGSWKTESEVCNDEGSQMSLGDSVSEAKDGWTGRRRSGPVSKLYIANHRPTAESNFDVGLRVMNFYQPDARLCVAIPLPFAATGSDGAPGS